jgi:hypothetical protein
MAEKIFTRMGDGSGIFLSPEDIRYDLEEGTKDAANRGKIPELTQEELDYLYEIIAMPVTVIGVKRGQEVVSSSDSGAFKITYQRLLIKAIFPWTGLRRCRFMKRFLPRIPWIWGILTIALKQ